jgi:hypothetical protein
MERAGYHLSGLHYTTAIRVSDSHLQSIESLYPPNIFQLAAYCRQGNQRNSKYVSYCDEEAVVSNNAPLSSYSSANTSSAFSNHNQQLQQQNHLLFMKESNVFPVQRVFLFRVKSHCEGGEKQVVNPNAKRDRRNLRSIVNKASQIHSCNDTYFISYTPVNVVVNTTNKNTNGNTILVSQNTLYSFYYIQKHANANDFIRQLLLLSPREIYEGTAEEFAWLPTGRSCSSYTFDACYQKARFAFAAHNASANNGTELTSYKCLVRTYVIQNNTIVQEHESAVSTSTTMLRRHRYYFHNGREVDVKRHYWILEFTNHFELRKRRIPFDLFRDERSRIYAKVLLSSNQIVPFHILGQHGGTAGTVDNNANARRWLDERYQNTTAFIFKNWASHELIEMIPEIDPSNLLDLIPDGNDIPL